VQFAVVRIYRNFIDVLSQLRLPVFRDVRYNPCLIVRPIVRLDGVVAGRWQKLTARAAATTRPGRYGDGGGLYLIVAPSGGRKWVFRFTFGGKVTEMGLGAANVVSLAEARDKARDARKVVEMQKNPIAAKRQAAIDRAGRPTFGVVADALIVAKESEWRNEKHRMQWRSSLTGPVASLRARPVDEIDTQAVLAVLTPLWQTKPETASRLRGRIEAVLDAAKAQGHRSGENPAAWRGHLSHLLPKRQKLTRIHHAAMDYRHVPTFLTMLRNCDTIAAMALEFTILTATRSGEVYGARWSEIDLEMKIWTIPACRMKAGREHRVPLSEHALATLEKLLDAKTCDFVFPSPRGMRPLSHVSMAKVVRRLRIDGPTVHGFRSAFRDWAGNETNFPREIAEAALAHAIGDKAEQAYRRGDALEKRRKLMDAWGAFCAERGTGKVVSIRR
jgi:integrase